MKELVSIILKLENDIWLNAWKRSGLVADYLTELDCAQSGILRGGPSMFFQYLGRFLRRLSSILHYLNDVQISTVPPLREEITFEEDIERVEEEEEEEREKQKEPESQATKEEIEIVDDQIPKTQKKLKQQKIASFFKKLQLK